MTNKISRLPRYVDSGKSFLELHSHHTFWSFENEKKTDEDIYAIVEVALIDFQEITKVEAYLLGKSGRHFCVKDTPENSKKYQYLQKVALKLEERVIKEFNMSIQDEKAVVAKRYNEGRYF